MPEQQNIESKMNKSKTNQLQIRNSTAEFLIFTKQANAEGIEVRFQDGTMDYSVTVSDSKNYRTKNLLATCFCGIKTPKVFNVDNPVQATGAARGRKNRRQPQSSTSVCFKLCSYGTQGARIASFYPALRYACTGLFTSHTYGVA